MATRLKLRLHALDGVVGGMLVLPATAEVIAAFIAAAEAAPDELSAIANVMPAPPLPFLAAEHHGRLVLMARLAWAGPVAAGERALAPFRALAEPLADTVRPIRYPELFGPDPDAAQPPTASDTLFLDDVDERAARTVVERVEAGTAAMNVIQLRVLGGAVARVADDATAFAHRRRRVLAVAAAMYGSPDEAGVHEGWVSGTAAALRRAARPPGAYVNFLGDAGEDRVREAYPGATWDRLRAIKTRYDPENLFRLNQNIPPA